MNEEKIYVRTNNDGTSHKACHFIGRMYKGAINSSNQLPYNSNNEGGSGAMSENSYRIATEDECRAFELGCIDANKIHEYLNRDLNYEIC